MPSTWIISTGQFFGPSGALVGTGYAGQPPHVNDATAVYLKNQGPLPPGQYRIGAPENLGESASWPAQLAHMGPYILPLTPLPDAQGSLLWLHDRCDFFVHGDRINKPGYASDGCMVPTKLPDGTENGRAVREVIAQIRLTDDVLNVVLTPPPIT